MEESRQHKSTIIEDGNKIGRYKQGSKMEEDIIRRYDQALSDCESIIESYNLGRLKNSLEIFMIGFNQLEKAARESAEEYISNGKIEKAKAAAVYYEEVLKRLEQQHDIRGYASRIGKYAVGLINQANLDMNAIYLGMVP